MSGVSNSEVDRQRQVPAEINLSNSIRLVKTDPCRKHAGMLDTIMNCVPDLIRLWHEARRNWIRSLGMMVQNGRHRGKILELSCELPNNTGRGEHNLISCSITHYRHLPHKKVSGRAPRDKTEHAALCRQGFQPTFWSAKGVDHPCAQICRLNPLQHARPRRINAERENANSYR